MTTFTFDAFDVEEIAKLKAKLSGFQVSENRLDG